MPELPANAHAEAPIDPKPPTLTYHEWDAISTILGFVGLKNLVAKQSGAPPLYSPERLEEAIDVWRKIQTMIGCSDYCPRCVSTSCEHIEQVVRVDTYV